MVKNVKGLDPKIYSTEYYLSTCLGSEEFKKFSGRQVNPQIKEYVSWLNIKKGTRILDIGCGRGDFAFEAARKGAEVIGIDYSKEGISLARKALRKQPQKIQRRIAFKLMDAKNLKFDDEYFDIVTSFDVFEHLYKQELEIALREIHRVLKRKGQLVVHTATNKLYLDFTHRIWCYPMDKMLLSVNKIFTNNDYPALPYDGRNDVHKKQHVNEPTLIYLRSLFYRNMFAGKIIEVIPYKPKLSIKDTLYNIVVYLYPVSMLFPLNLFFATEYVCRMKKIRD